MGIMDIFRPAQQAPQPSNQLIPQNNPGADPKNQEATKPSSPLDAFSDLLKNTNTDTGQSPDPFSQPLFNADPSKIAEAAGKADFLGTLPPDLVQKAMSGNDPQAFLDVINRVGQQSLAMAVQLTTATVEQAGTKLGSRFKDALPAALKDTQLKTMKSDNPVLQHPSSEPLLAMLRDRIRRNEPNLSAQEINKKAEEFLSTWAAELTRPAQAAPESSTSQEMDWDRWLSS